jgi:hypothetical protein
MKKNIPLYFIVFLSFIFSDAAAQPKGDKGKGQEKQQHGNQGKQNHGNQGNQPPKGNNGQKNKPQADRNNANRGDAANKNQPGSERGNSGVKGNDQTGIDVNGRGKNKNGAYAWTPETFKDRNQIRKSEKVTICHKFKSNDEPAVTISVSSNALQAHLDHGDIRGACPAIDNTRYSDDYLRKRTDYYNTLENSREEVLYSQSILDYAVQRLTNARLQLTNMRNNNVPAADIQRKQVVVTELEQNVSVLQQLLGVATNLVVNKLMQ